MRVVPRRWSNETWVCSLRGHCAPARSVATLRPEDRALGIDLGDGTRLCRCLRCDAWILTQVPGAQAEHEVLPAPERLPRPRRDAALESAILLRLIACERGLHSVLFTLLAIALVFAELDLPWLQEQISALVDNTSRAASQTWLAGELERLLGLQHRAITVLLVTAVAYAVVEGVEAVGLWRQKRWAEYLTVLATAGFLPFEVHALADRVTVVRLVALGVNLAVLVYLLWSKRLFGLRGGTAALRRKEGEATDWARLLSEPPVAPPG